MGRWSYLRARRTGIRRSSAGSWWRCARGPAGGSARSPWDTLRSTFASPGRILQPDVFVLSGRVPRRHRGPIERISELCVEVLSEDRVHDRVTKRLLYAAAGVKEYWVAEPAGLVERWSGPGLTCAETLRAWVRTALLPGFALDSRRLFATKAS